MHTLILPDTTGVYMKHCAAIGLTLTVLHETDARSRASIRYVDKEDVSWL